jgi:hypothetical protein
LTTAGYIFGGFTPIAWDSSSGWKADNTGKSFVFSLKNPRNTEPKIFPFSNASNVTYCGSSYGPRFGGNRDIYVENNCDQNTGSHTKLGNDPMFGTGEYHFQVKEIEVFTVSS